PWANDSDLANYGFLMQMYEYQFPAKVEFVLVRMTLVGVGLSVVGGLLSVFLVCYVPVRSDALFSICNMCIALIGAQLAFAGAENSFPEKIMCKFSTASLHYLFLSLHCWAMAFSLHLVMKFNICVLSVVLIVQYRHDTKKDLPRNQIIKNALSTTITQLPVTNVTWLLGLAPPKYYTFQYLFVIVNASQGALILTCHMLCSSQIRSLLKTRFHGMPVAEGQKPEGEAQMSKSNSTGGTQSMEMDIVGDGHKSLSNARKTNES
ncbi:Egf-like module-containing mucin-like hormone receptor-like 4, partial [Plakobranchus ocellatus]